MNGMTCCGTSCVDLKNNSANCGMCGKQCPAGTMCCGGACQSSVLPCLSTN
jgi:hypothetical protein